MWLVLRLFAALLLIFKVVEAAYIPRVFVYDLPADNNVLWSDRAFWSEDERTRSFARSPDWFYYTESQILLELTATMTRILDPKFAEIYFIPVFTSVLAHHNHHDVASSAIRTAMAQVRGMPFFDRYGGSDHVLVLADGTTYCWEFIKNELPNVTLAVVPPGPPPDCIANNKILPIPPFSLSLLRRVPHPHTASNVPASTFTSNRISDALPPQQHPRTIAERKKEPKRHLLYFRGMSPELDSMLPVNRIRQILFDNYGEGVEYNKTETKWKPAPDVMVSSVLVPFEDMLNEMKYSSFCMVLPGRTSYMVRLLAAIAAECVPVLVGVTRAELPFSSRLKSYDFIIHIEVRQIPRIAETLRQYPKEQWALKLSLAADAKRRLAYTEDTRGGGDDAVVTMLEQLAVMMNLDPAASGEAPHVNFRREGKTRKDVKVKGRLSRGFQEGPTPEETAEKEREKDSENIPRTDTPAPAPPPPPPSSPPPRSPHEKIGADLGAGWGANALWEQSNISPEEALKRLSNLREITEKNSGVMTTIVCAKLASLYVLAGKPEEAIKTIDQSIQQVEVSIGGSSLPHRPAETSASRGLITMAHMCSRTLKNDNSAIRAALMSVKSAPMFPPAYYSAAEQVLRTISGDTGLIIGLYFLGKALRLSVSPWNGASRIGEKEGPISFEMDLPHINTTISTIRLALGASVSDISGPPAQKTSLDPLMPNDGFSSVKCQYGSSSDVCSMNSVCFEDGHFVAYHKMRDGDAASDFKHFSPNAFRYCHSSTYRKLFQIDIEHRYFNPWRSHPAWSHLRPTRYIDSEVFVVDSPKCGPMTHLTQLHHYLPSHQKSVQKNINGLNANSVLVAPVLQNVVFPLYDTITTHSSFSRNPRIFFLNGYTNHESAWTHAVLGILPKNLQAEIPQGGRLCFRKVMIGVESNFGTGNGPTPSRHPAKPYLSAAAMHKKIMALRNHVKTKALITPDTPDTPASIGPSPRIAIVTKNSPGGITNLQEVVSHVSKQFNVTPKLCEASIIEPAELISCVSDAEVVVSLPWGGAILSLFSARPGAAVVVYPPGGKPTRMSMKCQPSLEHRRWMAMMSEDNTNKTATNMLSRYQAIEGRHRQNTPLLEFARRMSEARTVLECEKVSYEILNEDVNIDLVSLTEALKRSLKP